MKDGLGTRRYSMKELGLSKAEIEVMTLGTSYGNNHIFSHLDEEILAISLGISDNISTNGFIIQPYMDEIIALLLSKTKERSE